MEVDGVSIFYTTLFYCFIYDFDWCHKYKDKCFLQEIKRHNSFNNPHIKRAPIAKRVGRERCHSYHAQTVNVCKPNENRMDPPKVSLNEANSGK